MFKHSWWTRILLLTLIASVPGPPAQAEIRSATVGVDGMSCPFCAFGIEKRLKKVDGVRSIAISTKGGTARLVAKDGESIAVEQIPGAVKKAGFTPGTITVEAVGEITTDERNRVVLKVRGADQTLLVATFDAKREKRLRSLAAKGALVAVHGPLHHHVDDLSAITPERVEEIPA